MHDVYLSPQSRLTLLNTLTHKEILYSFSSSSFTKMCILEIKQMKIFDFSQSWNDFYQNFPLLATWVWWCV